MRNIIGKLLIGMMTLGMGQYALSAEPEQGKATVGSMTATQLEVAGDEARAAKDFDLANEYFQAAIRRDSRNPVLYNKLGLSQLQMNNLRSAKYSFQKAVKYNSKYADAINNIGAVHYKQNDYSAAARQFKKAVALDETRPSFHVNLGATWFAQKKLEGAIAEYARALELNPDALTAGNVGVAAQIASPEERARYSYMLAKIFAKRGDADQCIRQLRKAKEEGYRELANVYKDSEFAQMRNDSRLAEIAPAPER
jgi:tetratricopeptide (TPR) repeat protein